MFVRVKLEKTQKLDENMTISSFTQNKRKDSTQLKKNLKLESKLRVENSLLLTVNTKNTAFIHVK